MKEKSHPLGADRADGLKGEEWLKFTLAIAQVFGFVKSQRGSSDAVVRIHKGSKGNAITTVSY